MKQINGQIQKKQIDLGKYIRLLALIVLVIIVSVINTNFISSYNLKAMLESVGILMVMGIGTTFILLIGAMDLSIGANISCCAVVIALLIPRIGFLAFFAAIAVGVVIGLINGLLYCKLKIPSFIVTLGTMSIFNSAALLICGSVPVSLTTEYDHMVRWAGMKIGVLPIPFILSLGLMAVYALIQKNTKFGKSCYYIGASERTAAVGGIRVEKYKIMAFANNGLCCAFAAIIMVCRLKSGNPNVGEAYTMMAIAAVAFGGTALSGGRGGVVQTLLGCFLITVITQSLVILGVDIYWQKIVYGLIVVLAICTTVNKNDRALVVK